MRGWQARRMRKSGAKLAEIAQVLGISEGAACYICNPEIERAMMKRMTRRRQDQRAARHEWKKKLRDAANVSSVRKSGDVNIAEAYSLLRRTLDRLDSSEETWTGTKSFTNIG